MEDVIITLIHPGETEQDDEKTELFAEMNSTGRDEFTAAGQAGYKKSVQFVVWTNEYDDQPEVIYNGARLTIYRTFNRRDEKTELYAGERVGNR